VLGLLALTGAPLTVDHDAIDDTNPNRHLTASLANEGDAKAELLAALLRLAGADPLVKTVRWEALDPGHRSSVDLGVISVDDDAVRRAFQLDMPRLILNGGTNDAGLYQVTSHDFLNEACLGCIARADLQSANPEESLARRLGVPLNQLQPHLESTEPLPSQLLSQMAPEDANQLRRVPGREVARVACGHLRPLPGEPARSAPMLSAAPGILLAAEIVKRQMRAEAPLSTATNMLATSLLSGPYERWALQRHKCSNCTCRDDAYRDFYRRRWEGTSSAALS
jgi:hypothetical protein